MLAEVKVVLSGLGGLLVLIVGGIFYRKYRKQKLTAEEARHKPDGDLEERDLTATSEFATWKREEISSESDSETENVAGRGANTGQRLPSAQQVIGTNAIRSKRSTAAISDEEDGPGQKTLKPPRRVDRHRRVQGKHGRRVDSDTDSSDAEISSSSDDSEAPSRRK
jgi:hypothetical protein